MDGPGEWVTVGGNGPSLAHPAWLNPKKWNFGQKSFGRNLIFSVGPGGVCQADLFPIFPTTFINFSQVRAQSIEDKPELNKISFLHIFCYLFSVSICFLLITLFVLYPRQALKLDLKLGFLIFLKDILIEIFERRPFPYIVCVDVTLMRSWKLTNNVTNQL